MTLRLALEIGGDASAAKQALGDTVGAINQLTAAEARLNPKVHAERSRDVAAFGAELDRLRAKFNPIFALSKQYETELGEINRAHQLGAIATHEQAAAIDRLNAQYHAMAAAAGSAATATGMTTMQSRQLMFQLVDIGQTIPLAFQSPIFALQNVGFQVAQIGQLYYGQGGMRAALRDMIAMTGSFVAAIGPWPLLIGAAAAAGAVFFSTVSSGTAEADGALERHEALIGKIRDAWPEAAEAQRRYAHENPLAESSAVLETQINASIRDLREQLENAASGLLDDVSTFLQHDLSGEPIFLVHSEFSAFASAIETLRAGVRAGEPDMRAFREEVAALASENPEAAARLLELSEAAFELFAAGQDAAAGLNAIGRAAADNLARVERFGDALSALSGIASTLDERGQAAAALQDAIGAAQGADDAAVALAEYEAALGRVAAEEQKLADERGAREAKAEARAAERRTGRFFGSMDSVRGEIDDMRIAAATFGLAEDAAARYRVEQELVAAAQQAGVPITADLAAAIAGLAQEYGAATADLARLADEQERLDENRDLARGFFQDMRSGFQEGASLADTFANALGRVADRLAEMATNDLLDVLLGAQGSSGTGLLGSLFGSVFGSLFPSADGNVFRNGHLQAFASGGVVGGGIVDRPTIFPMANGAGLMGEAGPEAILPLRRGPNGRLGVETSGAASPVVLNYSPTIDARGADSEAVARLERQMERDRRDLPRIALQAVREAQSRRVQGF